MRRIPRGESVLALRVRDTARRELLPRAGAVRRAPDGHGLRLALRRGSTRSEEEGEDEDRSHWLQRLTSGHRRHLATPTIQPIRLPNRPYGSQLLPDRHQLRRRHRANAPFLALQFGARTHTTRRGPWDCSIRYSAWSRAMSG